MKLNLTKPLIVFDLETTGLDMVKDRIIQISYIKVYPDGTEVRKNQFINHWNQLAFLYFISILTVKFYPDLCIQKFKHPAKYLQACNDAILLADQIHLSGLRLFHNTVCRHILACNVLTQCA